MAELWFYSNNGRAAELPVSRDELRRLARVGALKSTDHVWTKGLEGWVVASSQEMFAEIWSSTRERSVAGESNNQTPEQRSRRRTGGGLTGKAIFSMVLSFVAVLGILGSIVAFFLTILGGEPESVRLAAGSTKDFYVDLQSNQVTDVILRTKPSDKLRVVAFDASGKRVFERDVQGGYSVPVLKLVVRRSGTYRFVVHNIGTQQAKVGLRVEQEALATKAGILPDEFPPENVKEYRYTLTRVGLRVRSLPIFKNLERGKWYCFEARSEAFKVYMELRDSDGELLASSWAANKRTQIRFAPPRDGQYKLIIAATDSRPGPFDLTVRWSP